MFNVGHLVKVKNCETLKGVVFIIFGKFSDNSFLVKPLDCLKISGIFTADELEFWFGTKD